MFPPLEQDACQLKLKKILWWYWRKKVDRTV